MGTQLAPLQNAATGSGAHKKNLAATNVPSNFFSSWAEKFLKCALFKQIYICIEKNISNSYAALFYSWAHIQALTLEGTLAVTNQTHHVSPPVRVGR